MNKKEARIVNVMRRQAELVTVRLQLKCQLRAAQDLANDLWALRNDLMDALPGGTPSGECEGGACRRAP